jgi:hypothetical protein
MNAQLCCGHGDPYKESQETAPDEWERPEKRCEGRSD